MSKISSDRNRYWSNLRVAGSRLKGHVVCFGHRVDVDLVLGAFAFEPDVTGRWGFAAVAFDGTARWFPPDDPALPSPGDEPLEFVAHIFVEGEIVESVFVCVSCGRSLEADETLGGDYDGEPDDCRHCKKIKATAEKAHRLAVELSQIREQDQPDAFRKARGALEQSTGELDETWRDLHAVHDKQKQGHRDAENARRRRPTWPPDTSRVTGRGN